MKKTLLFSTLFLATTLLWNTGYAQKIKLMEGNLSAMKSETQLNVQYDYSQMGVGKFKTEDEYLSKKSEEYNNKEAGKGDKWMSDWKSDRKDRFEPKFEELFNKTSPYEIGNNSKAKYTLILKTTFTEPGFNVYVTRKNAMIDADVLIVETTNPGNVIAKMTISKSPGRTFGGYDFDTGVRIQEAYAAAGKALGKFMKK